LESVGKVLTAGGYGEPARPNIDNGFHFIRIIGSVYLWFKWRSSIHRKW